ncbi:MAG: lipoprotein signal peptidase [Cyanobacteria bacterium]|nr:lipoprotein signal peptidase [Cyanobacteria bacterium CG_2015-16_32_12]NCO78109.1 lipoprotein signal peptidase [Cyanobacteria bacterium CG_2015-22_32_23]NCQ04034.1 lipoprotein signal peptidase [Cyanobacteria bacterium CG_2015-09_32_10]NCQ42643.1 lipoprotein signal peptidase [Cyanobacteria bacterium CG_2015-04_32_10]NCS84029.1 lipoprotein signal peptidase [Cyanobacteria bacterium CG_2015-02_32_10]
MIKTYEKNSYFWLVAITALILDQITKYLITKNFQNVGETFPLWGGVFHLTYVQNTGAAFSFFRGGAGWLRWLSLLVSLGLMIFAWREKLSKVEQLAYGFILAGALGNGIDRFLFGYVVDFLDFRLINFPVFNIADMCINIGIIFLIYATIKASN